MSRVDGSALMFDEDELRQVRGSTVESLLPRLARVIFYGLQVTNDSYLQRYYHYYRALHPNKSRKEFNLKASSDRRFLHDKNKLTFNMLTSVLSGLGFDVEVVTIELRDRLTGQNHTFSTNDSIEDLRKLIGDDDVIGSPGIM